MTHTVSLTITAEGTEDVAKLLSALKMAGLEAGNSPKPRKNKFEESKDAQSVVQMSNEDFLKLIEVREKPVKALSNFNKTDKPKTRTTRKKWLTETTKRKLRKLAKEGKTMKEASVLTGIPYMNIYQWQKNPKSKVSFVTGKKGRKGAQ